MKERINIIKLNILLLFCGIILAFSLRGLAGNPTAKELNSEIWKEQGPFELSPERGRFALLYSVVEDHSLKFSNNVGVFAIPDVAITKEGRYASLFAPILSFIAIPGYMVGKYFGASQVGAFAVVAIFALLNFVFLRLIAIRLGANSIAATVASLVFLFATPAFAYAVNLYQHHLSTLLILLSIYVLLKSNKAWSLIVVFFICAAAIPLDYPNLFFMFPIAIFALGRIVSFKKIKHQVSFKLNLLRTLTPIIMIIPILFFLWFNQASYGKPFQLSGTLPAAKHVQDSNDLASIIREQNDIKNDANEKSNKKSAVGFFQTRNLVNGFYIHFISPDRGMIFYTPVMLFGLIGIILAIRKRVYMASLLIAIIGVDVLLYSLWGDPWGGWAFGSRYLIPSYVILSIFIALFLTFWRKKYFLMPFFALVAFYSVAVNTLGAITTSALPPQVEVLELEKLSGIVQKYTYERNWDFLLAGHSKSFVYQTFLGGHISALWFYFSLVFLICAVLALLLILNIQKKRRIEDNA